MDKYWNPAEFGEKKDDEVECFAFMIANLPLFPDKMVKKFIKEIHKFDGFVGMRPEYPYGTFLIFKTENDAKIGRNKILYYPGYEGGVGDNIGKVYISKDLIS